MLQQTECRSASLEHRERRTGATKAEKNGLATRAGQVEGERKQRWAVRRSFRSWASSQVVGFFPFCFLRMAAGSGVEVRE